MQMFNCKVYIYTFTNVYKCMHGSYLCNHVCVFLFMHTLPERIDHQISHMTMKIGVKIQDNIHLAAKKDCIWRSERNIATSYGMHMKVKC